MIKLFSLLLLATFGHCSKQRKYLTPEPIRVNTHDVNRQCPSLKLLYSAQGNGNSIENRLQLPNPVLVQKLTLDTSLCDADRELIERNFSIHYQDASDMLKLDNLYSDDLFGQWGNLDGQIEILLDPVMYTDHITLTSYRPMKCSDINVYGCTTIEICPSSTCKNNGICIGNGLCACQKGFMGERCEISVSNMSFDDYDFVHALPNLLLTKDASFDVSGEVDFTIAPKSDPNSMKRSDHHSSHHNHHGSSSHFHGSGGSCSYSSSHNGGYSHNGHSTYGHHPSNSRCSSILTQPSGYCHTAQVSYGSNHHHGETHYIYTTHGTSHHSHGASLQYSNNQLCMHVHDSAHHGHHSDHHYQVVAPFNPKSDTTYSVCSSYSPHNGAGIYVNGQQVATQTKPTAVTAATSPPPTTTTAARTSPHPTASPPIQGSLCFGSCGASSGGGHHNYSMSNIAIAGGSLPLLGKNLLLGLLGVDIIKLLQHNLPSTHPPTTTKQHVGFTPVPPAIAHVTITQAPKSTTSVTTTLPPASATTGFSGATIKNAPICYDCMHVNSTGSCAKTMQCNQGDDCLIMHDRFGYTQRCLSKQDCTKGSQTSLADCWNCCDGHLCNDHCTPSTTTPTTSGCKDELQCFSLKGLGAYYDVCGDPVYSSSVCKKSCGNCP